MNSIFSTSFLKSWLPFQRQITQPRQMQSHGKQQVGGPDYCLPAYLKGGTPHRSTGCCGHSQGRLEGIWSLHKIVALNCMIFIDKSLTYTQLYWIHWEDPKFYSALCRYKAIKRKTTKLPLRVIINMVAKIYWHI